MILHFTKMHGAGNDFVVIDERRQKIPNPTKTTKQIADRRFGIGADQILVVGPSRKADFSMKIYNSDGGEVEMCGNGLRCLAKFVRDKKMTSKNEISVETPSGVQQAKILGKNQVRIDMGPPILKGNEIPVKLSGRVINRPIRANGKEIRGTCVSMGNPHCVIFVDDPKTYPVETYGPLLEKNRIFPNKTNVEFVKVHSPKLIEMRVWERGAGETLACGSGACAAVVACVLNNQTERKVKVQLLGGDLEIEWNRQDDHVYMTGPAETVFEGEIEL